MARTIKVAAAQVGAINIDASRSATLARLLTLLDEAASQKVQLVVYPECTLTTFFPRHLITSATDLSSYFESADITTSPATAPLFQKASAYGIDIVVGYAEKDEASGKPYNTSIYYSASAGRVISKYRKVHLPGTVEPFEEPGAVNQLEKRYFTPGDLGFEAFRAPGLVSSALKKSASPSSVDAKEGESTETKPPPQGEISDLSLQGKGDPILGMLICNDRRWPEAWRAYALQGAELLVFGYNTGAHLPHLRGDTSHTSASTPVSAATPLSPADAQKAEREALFHSRLVQQANSYMNACYSISAARCGDDDGEAKYALIAGSAIVDPEGHVVAEARTKGDELVVAEIDLGVCRIGKERTFEFGKHRRVEHYGVICERAGVVEPELLGQGM